MTATPATQSSTLQRTRVAVVSSVHRWNDTRIFVKQAGSLAAAGYDVLLVAISDKDQEFERNGMRVHTLPRLARHKRWVHWIRILRIAMAERAEIVHAHDPELFPVVLLLKLVGRRVICDVHEDVAEQVREKEWIPRYVRGILSALLRWGQRLLPRLADGVILAEDSYRRNFPAAENVVIVRNFPLLPDKFKTDYATDRLRLIYVGDVRVVRGIAEYVEIAARLVRRSIPVELRIVGSFADPREQARIVERIHELGIDEQVRLLGRRPPEEIADLVVDCDVGLALLHPIGNYRESYPTKMFEYMACGLPTVASNFKLWEGVLIENDCGRVVDPFDVDAAADALAEYWASAELRERHGRNGRAAMKQRYQWGLDLPVLLKVYSGLTRDGRRALPGR